MQSQASPRPPDSEGVRPHILCHVALPEPWRGTNIISGTESSSQLGPAGLSRCLCQAGLTLSSAGRPVCDADLLLLFLGLFPHSSSSIEFLLPLGPDHTYMVGDSEMTHDVVADSLIDIRQLSGRGKV